MAISTAPLSQGGANGDGTVFRMTTNGIVSLVHSFSYGIDGAMPYAALTQGTNGSLYGVNYLGGSSGDGTVFRMTTNGVNHRPGVAQLYHQRRFPRRRRGRRAATAISTAQPSKAVSPDMAHCSG